MSEDLRESLACISIRCAHNLPDHFRTCRSPTNNWLMYFKQHSSKVEMMISLKNSEDRALSFRPVRFHTEKMLSLIKFTSIERCRIPNKNSSSLTTSEDSESSYISTKLNDACFCLDCGQDLKRLQAAADTYRRDTVAAHKS